MTKRHNISVNDKTYKRLNSHGRFGESYDEIVGRLLDIAETSVETRKRTVTGDIEA